METMVRGAEIAALLTAEHSDPFSVLGPHRVELDAGPALAVRVLAPAAASASLLAGGSVRAMERLHADGFFEAVFPGAGAPFPYRVRLEFPGGVREERADPYAFPPVLSDFDLHLLSEGTHLESYKKLGAHPMRHGGVPGVVFAVWAPNAARVSVVGDFNLWDGRRHMMRPRGASGVWELFIPELSVGSVYKYEIRSRLSPTPFLKADPCGFFHEKRPKTASIVWHDSYEWKDAEWMERRARANPLDKPILAYEVHLGSWKRVPEQRNRFLSYAELAEQLVPYARGLGYTHLELMPVTEHPYDGSWGYQTVGYFAPTSRFGTPEDFKAFVDACHQAGLGVILDWVPSHFPTDAHGLGRFDGTALYEHADPRKGFHPDWNTLIFNFGRNEVRNFLLSNGLFWLKEYHVDGLRVDAVASMIYLDYSRKAGEWIPNRFGGNENLEAIDFLKTFNTIAHRDCPGILTVAEESTAWPAVSRPVHAGGLGFSMKWNMGWMHDSLKYMGFDPIYRKHHHYDLTFSMLYAYQENFQLPLSHDEVVHGKSSLIGRMPGYDPDKFANLRAYFGFMAAHPGKKLLFMGGEFAQRDEWAHDRSLDWHLLQYAPHQGMQRWVGDLNRLVAAEPALHEVDFEAAGFEWIDCNDAAASVFTFLRFARRRSDFIVAAVNFTPVPREGYRVGVPEPGFYREVANSDSEFYGGGNRGNAGGVWADSVPWNGRPHSLRLTLPPLSALLLKNS